MCTMIPKSNAAPYCVHFPQFVVGCGLRECMCHKNLSSAFRIFAEANEIHAFHTNLTRSKLENNGKSFFRSTFNRTGDGLYYVS